MKMAADYYPETRVLATGSSTLGASAKFKDTLAGRKVASWLTSMTAADLKDFGQPDLEHRLLRGGLPRLFLSPELPEKECFRDNSDWPYTYTVALAVVFLGGLRLDGCAEKACP